MTFDVGVNIRLGDNVYLAAVGQNLTYPNNALLPTIVGGGIGFGNANLSIEGDGVADLTSWGKPTARLGIGGEYLAADHVPIRLGYRFDQGPTSTRSPPGSATSARSSRSRGRSSARSPIPA